MIELLKKIESEEIISLLSKPEIWNSLDIDYHPPRVERIWCQYGDYRIYLHFIHECTREEALYHSHPWPSAVHIVDGLYETGVGSLVEGDKIETYATFVINAETYTEGTYYEMLNKKGFHYVRPLSKITKSVMLTGKPWSSETAPRATKELEKLSAKHADYIRNWFLLHYIRYNRLYKTQ